MNEKFYALSVEKQSQILNAAYKVFATNQYKKAPTSEIAAEAGISKSLLFHYFHNKRELYLFLWNYAADLTRKYMCEYKVYETDDFFEMLLSILNLDFIRKDIEFVCIYKEILYASDGMLKYWYRTGNYDVTAFEQEYLEMINHWEMVYGKGKENDRKQL